MRGSSREVLAEAELDEVRFHAAQMLSGIDPPAIDAAVAVGGSAASLRRLVGDVLDRHSLARALEALTSGPATDVAGRFELDPQRVRLMPAGLLALSDIVASARRHGMWVATRGEVADHCLPGAAGGPQPPT